MTEHEQLSAYTTELARWRGNMEARMAAIELTISEVKGDLRDIRASTQHNGELLATLVATVNKKNGSINGPQPVTFKWLMEKLAIPLLLAVNAAILGLMLSHVIQSP